MCEHGTDVVVPHPPFDLGRVDPERGIAIDACIADVVQAIWAAGYVTLSSCCGHGDAFPSLVIGDHETHEAIDAMEAIIKANDDRSWWLHQWQLIDVRHTTPAASSDGGAA